MRSSLASCLRRTRFSARSARKERKNETTSRRNSQATPTIARARCNMSSSCQSQPAAAGVGHPGARSTNYCGPQVVDPSCGDFSSQTGFWTPPLTPFIRAVRAFLLVFGMSWLASAEEPRPVTAILLVARAELSDPNFKDAVVLVLNNIAPVPAGLIP